jgi:hypothetical protein
MEDTSLYSDREVGSYGAYREERLASDARNLVRERFPRQMPQRDLLTLASPRVIPTKLTI